ncbi:hypothetical protein CEXT_411821 [Caerostris extrusa]|uniref:Secreted protein n=1 Tax=Caerostris extrusa TaxID=172846 RepID=A0AAV4SPS8_CAEEX|nr:hypothetical protein CEXT_411821 [Caerostris extrusa]
MTEQVILYVAQLILIQGWAYLKCQGTNGELRNAPSWTRIIFEIKTEVGIKSRHLYSTRHKTHLKKEKKRKWHRCNLIAYTNGCSSLGGI